MSDILDKARQCFVMYLGAGATTMDQVYNAKGFIDKEETYIAVDAMNAKEEPMGVGNFLIDIEVTIKTMAPVDSGGADTKQPSDDLTLSVLALLELDNDSLMAVLNTFIPQFTVMGFGDLKELEQATEGSAWITKWRRRIYCGGF